MKDSTSAKVVIFDLDDTLIPNVVYYNKTKQKIVNLFQQFFGESLSEIEILKDYGKVDLAKVKKLGLSRTRFPLAAVELYLTYSNFFGRQISSDEIDEVYNTANAVFDVVEELSEEASAVICSLLEKGYIVYLLTSGDEIVQTYKIFKTKIYQLLDNDKIIIVPEKNNDIYSEIFKKYGLNNCCMCGNSRRSDINPAISCGMYAIHVPEDTWELDYEVLKESDKLYTAHSLKLIPDILDDIFESKVEAVS